MTQPDELAWRDRLIRWLLRLRTLARAMVGVGIMLGTGLVVLLGFAGYNLVVGGTPEDVPYTLAIVMLSAASISLFTISFLVAALTLVGWRQMQDHVRAEVDNAAKELHDAHKGENHLVIGFFLGQGARKDQGGVLVVPDECRALLRSAISHSKRAVALLEGREKYPKAVNNLAFYYALDGNPNHARRARDCAAEVLSFFDEDDDPLYLNTYAAVVAAFPREFGLDTVTEATERLEALVDDPSVPQAEQENARRHLKMLGRASRELRGDDVV